MLKETLNQHRKYVAKFDRDTPAELDSVLSLSQALSPTHPLITEDEL